MKEMQAKKKERQGTELKREKEKKYERNLNRKERQGKEVRWSKGGVKRKEMRAMCVNKCHRRNAIVARKEGIEGTKRGGKLE